MTIKYIFVTRFGNIRSYRAELKERMNVLGTRHGKHLALAFDLITCKVSAHSVRNEHIKKNTLISAEVMLGEDSYSVKLEPLGGKLELSAYNCEGKNITPFYISRMTHSTEQDSMESFNGDDTTLSKRLSLYSGYDTVSASDTLEARTGYLSKTRSFHLCATRMIKEYTQERIVCAGSLGIYLGNDGVFKVLCDREIGSPSLSDTENRLFLYICFLNIVRFWEEFQSIRDLHHEKKPLLVKNFIEFLDGSVDTEALVRMTLKSNRQVIAITEPMSEKEKAIWNI